ncbi:short-chain dehydrogenase [bacterium (Candidatus Blackallbacteria) CG17_big_fil_post_rev_8_21_14_2_50_48_46]|uniref:Short-chain dehydrogenase n=1 Tax=bacterium (Candidatus Blackallbacteria) CG17_big_fil_post_rev_8_21_14_2_50_48_46 TaxID=2014261 RepID=A0A2M7G8U2_9BACT|nr:MAG: short-chain dehydrogenase [bacterium (Candidatus Blackallbacteria) CG18_big_fil_WC_8_21_14_2_50_49_26]PIW18461.1 MAG: short-chain dehydrogenase [bacterium (Candidatus Blackallbacteria) CG17_big_fil_post_rev_8_21_14_2_50_48_46]PIW46554.1 MAG: short-chain dehydrogenase [bacterium (Candidatus Blackallbacteria) CG13_big_fil_rev_8_21_14_2_50_49_14]
MEGKVCLITGATSGIGKVTARELAARGAHVILVGRNPDKTAAVTQEIQAQTDGQVEFIIADLSIQSEIRNLAEEVQKRTDHLDILVNNAGAVFARRELSVDGYEMTWALNHLAYFLLTHLLLDLLKSSAPSRIINVASTGHFGAVIDFPNLQGEQRYDILTAYGQSKLANVLFTFALARRLENTDVTVNCLHPGVVATDIWSLAPAWTRPVLKFGQKFMISPEKGAETILYLATSPEVEHITGKYFERKKIVPSSKISLNENLQERLWILSKRMTGLYVPSMS